MWSRGIVFSHELLCYAMAGQVNPESSLGRVLEAIARDEQYTTYVDIGTWNGLGTTRCLVNGMRGRKTTGEIWSYESNFEQYQLAVTNWTPCPPYLHLVNGTLHRDIVDIRGVDNHPAIRMFQRSSGTEYLHWHSGERKCLMSAPLVQPPASIDVVVLDGGEFTTIGDWNIVKERNPRVVVLDDTSAYKTWDIRKELLHSPEWVVVHDVPHERHGWAVFKRVDVFHDE